MVQACSLRLALTGSESKRAAANRSTQLDVKRDQCQHGVFRLNTLSVSDHGGCQDSLVTDTVLVWWSYLLRVRPVRTASSLTNRIVSRLVKRLSRLVRDFESGNNQLNETASRAASMEFESLR
jgi:hypothetical protein